MPKILVICGPTASGKTELAVNCALALHSEIISADSMLVYRDLNIGTAKPTEEEKRGVPHHLIDVVEPSENFSVSDYEKSALPVTEKLLSLKKTPIVCGGTGFYIRALLYKSQFGNAGADERIRKKYEQILFENGKDYLHNLLREKDPESAEILHPNDTKRVIRALEIFDITGKKNPSSRTDLFRVSILSAFPSIIPAKFYIIVSIPASIKCFPRALQMRCGLFYPAEFLRNLNVCRG